MFLSDSALLAKVILLKNVICQMTPKIDLTNQIPVVQLFIERMNVFRFLVKGGKSITHITNHLLSFADFNYASF